MHSLIPRCSTPPVFDRLQYVKYCKCSKTGGVVEGLGISSLCLSVQGFTSQQMSMVEQSTVMIEEREKEIRSIVQSISEINEMYRDLATMIVDQVRGIQGRL